MCRGLVSSFTFAPGFQILRKHVRWGCTGVALDWYDRGGGGGSWCEGGGRGDRFELVWRVTGWERVGRVTGAGEGGGAAVGSAFSIVRYFIKNILRTSAVSSTNFGSILIFCCDVVGVSAHAIASSLFFFRLFWLVGGTGAARRALWVFLSSWAAFHYL